MDGSGIGLSFSLISKAMKGTASRAIGALLAPEETFVGMGSGRSWWDVLTSCALYVGLLTWLLWASASGAAMTQANREKMRTLVEERVPEEQQELQLARLYAAELRPHNHALRAAGAVSFLAVLYAGILHLAMSTAFLNRDVKYRAVLAVVGHSAVATAVGVTVTSIISFLRAEPVGSNLPALLPAFSWPTDGIVHLLLERLDPFGLWGVWLVSIGLARVYDRPKWKVAAIIGLLFVGWYAVAIALVGVAKISTGHGIAGH